MQKPPNEDDPPKEKNPAAAQLGRLGGLKGGAVRASRMTPEERAEASRKAAEARWTRVAEERRAEEGLEDDGDRGRLAKPFVLTLTPDEALEITEARGKGGHQSLHRRLVTELAKGDLNITLNDRQFGELVRYMTRYKSGGFQGRLRRAFERSLRELLGL